MSQQQITGFEHFEGCGENWVRQPAGAIFRQEQIHPHECPRCQAIAEIKLGDRDCKELDFIERQKSSVEMVKQNHEGDFNPFV